MSISSRKMDVEGLLSYGDDLIQVLKNKKDIHALAQLHEHAKKLQSSCNADFSDLHNQLKDYQERVNACKLNVEKAKTEVVADTEFGRLQNELEELLQEERSINHELRVISKEIDDLECERVSVDEQKGILKKVERNELRQQKKLSMYASVTNIIPDLGDETRISGQIVDRDKRVVEKFEYDPKKTFPIEICNSLWKLMDH